MKNFGVKCRIYPKRFDKATTSGIDLMDTDRLPSGQSGKAAGT
jgi:hypothetical protein